MINEEISNSIKLYGHGKIIDTTTSNFNKEINNPQVNLNTKPIIINSFSSPNLKNVKLENSPQQTSQLSHPNNFHLNMNITNININPKNPPRLLKPIQPLIKCDRDLKVKIKLIKLCFTKNKI